VQPTNRVQYDDAAAERVPAPDEVREGIWSIPLPMEQPGNPFSLCYLISGSDGALHLIDSGYDTDENWLRLQAALAGWGRSVDEVASVFVTHLHPDHLGLSERLRAASGASVGMLRREHEAVLDLRSEGPTVTAELLDGWGVPREVRAELLNALGSSVVNREAPQVDRDAEPGETLDIPGRTITIVATPGHTVGSACLVDADAGLVYTGDTVLPKIFPGIGLGGRSDHNPLADYLTSLRSLEPYDDLEVAPGHGYRFRGLAERARQLAEHQLQRSRAAAAVIASNPDARVWEVASRLPWSAGFTKLHGFFLLSALSQTQLHVEFAHSEEFPG
jgi:glyoxylase-like metal-dependent hydrolase (beta-lactamase superfamily II)